MTDFEARRIAERADGKEKWNIRHFLKDGTELKPGMQFPDTPENRATIERVREICRKGIERMKKDGRL